TNFTLRPPGDCGGALQCGYLWLQVSDSSGSSISTQGAATALDVKLSALPASNTYSFIAELRIGNAPVKVHGQVLRATLSVKAKPCQIEEAGLDAGSDANDSSADSETDSSADAEM